MAKARNIHLYQATRYNSDLTSNNNSRQHLPRCTKYYLTRPYRAPKLLSQVTNRDRLCYVRCIHCMMSFLITESDQFTPRIDGKTWDVDILRRLYWVEVPAAFGGRIIIAMVGKGFGHILVDEVKKCRSESLLKNLEYPLGFSLGVAFSFVMLTLELPPLVGFPWGWLRIWADGFSRSRNRRMKFPTLRPTSMSLSWMLRWTLSAMSNAARVRL